MSEAPVTVIKVTGIPPTSSKCRKLVQSWYSRACKQCLFFVDASISAHLWRNPPEPVAAFLDSVRFSEYTCSCDRAIRDRVVLTCVYTQAGSEEYRQLNINKVKAHLIGDEPGSAVSEYDCKMFDTILDKLAGKRK